VTTITIHESGEPPREVVVCRIPCQYEFLTLGEERWKVTSVTHKAVRPCDDIYPEVVCNVMRLGEKTP
jgi:hypothetical protein